MKELLCYVVPIVELRRSLYHACEAVFNGQKTVDFMYNELCAVMEDDITECCKKYDPNAVELRVNFGRGR